MRKSVLSVLAAAAVVALAGCSASPTIADSGSKNTIKIGAWVTTSGPIAVSGVPQAAGTQAYFDMINASGGCNGHQIDWITQDNAYDPQQTIQIARSLVQQDNVIAIVSAYGTATSEAAFSYVLDQSKVPILNTAGGASSWYTPSRDNLFGVEALYEDQGAALGSWAAEEEATKIVVVHSDPDAFVNVAKNVAPGAKSVNSSVNVELLPVKYHSTDYSPVVQQVQSKNADAVVLILSPEEAAAYLKEAKLQGLDSQTYGYAPDASTATLTLAGDAAEGFHTLSLVRAPDGNTPELKEYQAAMAKYAPTQPIDFVTETGFARAKAFCEVVKTIQGDVTSESISDAYTNASSVVTGLLSDMSFSADTHIGTRQVLKLVVKDGKFTEVDGEFYAPTRTN
ncbi:branched-chain amino acid ABC transporter [Cryobacterium sp. TMS1-20-1]|uniref:ABC transporter substrate-binding protein n=1 Tax=Cryobacterium sp. TMS1-20-1 TaxID=1259223 RepID=UPI00106C23CA|nr:ABC transporter substrate-binding protein [Cryobacterium sp. TMS1-20-1]TFC74884.1 branched-chain amino acid ABC transporter [Cryobacterium sp. TMS1-20-1]